MLAKSEETSSDNAFVRNLKPNEYIRLHQRIVPVAMKVLADSLATFGIMVWYTLTPD
ncbi:MAG TPA: hypothetical protein VGT79_02975 [Xanthomonadaceae bacterium]|nr:hypothetical protein [Xanthomonadaceae bacterium]